MKIYRIFWRNQLSSLNRASTFDGVLASYFEDSGFDFRIINSYRFLGHINPLKVPIVPLINLPNILWTLGEFKISPLHLTVCFEVEGTINAWPIDGPSPNHRTFMLVHSLCHRLVLGKTSSQA